jgi:hypothetical protein
MKRCHAPSSQASETDPDEENAVWNLHLHELLYRDLGRAPCSECGKAGHIKFRPG